MTDAIAIPIDDAHEVTACFDCPFVRREQRKTAREDWDVWCGNDDAEPLNDPEQTQVGGKEAPTWCPLREEPALVMLKAAARRQGLRRRSKSGRL